MTVLEILAVIILLLMLRRIPNATLFSVKTLKSKRKIEILYVAFWAFLFILVGLYVLTIRYTNLPIDIFLIKSFTIVYPVISTLIGIAGILLGILFWKYFSKEGRIRLTEGGGGLFGSEDYVDIVFDEKGVTTQRRLHELEDIKDSLEKDIQEGR